MKVKRRTIHVFSKIFFRYKTFSGDRFVPGDGKFLTVLQERINPLPIFVEAATWAVFEIFWKIHIWW